MITHREPRRLPSDTDVQFYREHGWYRSPRVLSEDVLDAAFIGISRHFDGERDWLFPPEQVFRLVSIGRQLRGLGCAPTSRRCIFSSSAPQEPRDPIPQDVEASLRKDPRVLIEAAAMQVPVVATCVMGIPIEPISNRFPNSRRWS